MYRADKYKYLNLQKGCVFMPFLQREDYTTEDIYALPEGTRAELIDGQIYYMAPPSRRHQRISTRLASGNTGLLILQKIWSWFITSMPAIPSNIPSQIPSRPVSMKICTLISAVLKYRFISRLGQISDKPWFLFCTMLYYRLLQSPQKQGLIGLSPIPGVGHIPVVYASAAFVRYPCKHGCLTHCCAKMNRVFVTFHS